MQPIYHIVEICHIEDPRAEELFQANKDLGHWVYKFRGFYILILGGDRVWTSESL